MRVGWWCDRLSKRLGPRWGCRIPALTGLSLAAVLLVLGAMAQSAAVAVILLSLCFGCTQLTDPAYWSAAIAVADRRARRMRRPPTTAAQRQSHPRAR